MLITGIGGPAGLSVAESLRKAGNYYLIGVDCDPMVSNRFFPDKFTVVPPASDDKFIPNLIKLSGSCNYLFCTVDEELPKVAEAVDNFKCKVFVSPPKTIELCLDKFKTFKALSRAGLPAPKTVTFELGIRGLHGFNFPLIVKPRTGRGSRNVFKIVSDRELEAVSHLLRNRKLLIQEYVEGPEYTVDVLADEESELVACVPRERVRIREGLTFVGRTVKDSRFEELAAKLAKALNLKYIFNFQCRGFELKITEVNPRPSGTLILSTMAGVNMPEILVKGELKPGAYLGKFKENLWLYRSLNNYVVELP